MKNYTKPKIEITTFLSEDSMVVTTSNINTKKLVESTNKNVIQLG